MSDKEQKAPAGAPASGGGRPGGAAGAQKVVWDDSQMQTTFANVVNGASTREEVTLFFGTNQTWNPDQSREVKVQLTNRMILTPFAAKRLWLLLGAIVQSYEKAYGTLNLEPQARPGGGTA